MSRSVWSTALVSLLHFGLAFGLVSTSGCIGKRRPQAEDETTQRKQDSSELARLIQPDDVDGSFDDQIEGDRIRALYDERDPSEGAALPLVTIVEYSDFECPFCSRLANTLHNVAREYPKDVKLVFKQFPLPMHRNAEPAARASLAAHAQGKFWDMHNEMFFNQKKLGGDQLEGYAVKLGLDIDKWKADFASPAIRDHVAEELATGRALEITSTPTFFINGKFFKGAQPPEQVKALIDAEILAAQKLLKAGVKREELYARFLHKAPALAAPDAAPEAKADIPGLAKPAEADPDHKYGEASRVPNYAVPVGAGTPIKGPADALVTIVEFGAFDCETCRKVQPTLQKLMAKYPKDVRLVFRQLPEGNPARRLAQVALAAHKQGKFWEAHDKLMALEGELTVEVANTLAAELKVDLEKFQNDLRDRAEGGPMRMIAQDIATIDVFRGEAPAPLFFVNGRYLDELPSLADFDKLVVEEKAKAEQFMKTKGVADKASLYEAMLKTWRGYDRTQNIVAP
ncbi:MAG: thioredoxin domain-containing protein [Deltaproteobacteria bacterium]|nr:thioredoxin domain-containing protein [Deltaproteobacteria bacterium]